ncbi:hypothetical protein EVAR_60390_1 [Eumeta japonica]|uniref:Uncharacterized protein n=1 Tax=Eumeta variegata TaxID=151549 RepID=A0A4C1YNF8_EUMVA|nr:hypothetical protein EVAR_60390_1 [Eumeta japonica]
MTVNVVFPISQSRNLLIIYGSWLKIEKLLKFGKSLNSHTTYTDQNRERDLDRYLECDRDRIENGNGVEDEGIYSISGQTESLAAASGLQDRSLFLSSPCSVHCWTMYGMSAMSACLVGLVLTRLVPGTSRLLKFLEHYLTHLERFVSKCFSSYRPTVSINIYLK